MPAVPRPGRPGDRPSPPQTGRTARADSRTPPPASRCSRAHWRRPGLQTGAACYPPGKFGRQPCARTAAPARGSPGNPARGGPFCGTGPPSA
eukprot:1881459-Alexandrium_andersonii.AAC.1